MKYGLTMLLVCVWIARSASAELIIVSDTTLDTRMGQLDVGTIQIYDGPDFPTTVEIVDGAHITGNIHVRGHSVLNMRGGITESFILGHDYSTINIFGGIVAKGEDIEMDDNSVANIYGGQWGDDIEARGSATVNLYGGLFERVRDGGTLGVGDNGLINVYLREFRTETDELDRMHLVGTLLDGSHIDVQLWVDPFELRNAQIVLHAIPEPDSIALAFITGLILSIYALTRRSPRERRTGLR